jgi:hypothetical protein
MYLPSEALLDCGHTGAFDPAPTPGDTVYCHRCVDYRIVRAPKEVHQIACRDCTMTRAYGSGIEQAKLAATNHARRYKGHHVALTRNHHTLFFYTRVRNTIIDILTQSPDKPFSTNQTEVPPLSDKA